MTESHLMKRDFIFHEPEDRYHARSKSGEVMSSHMLATFSKCPYRYLNKIQNPQDDDNSAFAFGRAAHKFILEGETAFDECYVVSDGPVNQKTGTPYGKTTKAYAEWLADQYPREVVSTREFQEIQEMFESIRHNSTAIKMLSAFDREAELVARTSWEGYPCQIRMDSFSHTQGIIDLKTCRDIFMFEKDIRDYGYVSQMAFYQSVLKEATGRTYPVHIIAVDKSPEHLCGVWAIPQDELDLGISQNRASMRRFLECKASGVFPTGFESKKYYSSEKWRMRKEAQ